MVRAVAAVGHSCARRPLGSGLRPPATCTSSTGCTIAAASTEPTCPGLNIRPSPTRSPTGPPGSSRPVSSRWWRGCFWAKRFRAAVSGRSRPCSRRPLSVGTRRFTANLPRSCTAMDSLVRFVEPVGDGVSGPARAPGPSRFARSGPLVPPCRAAGRSRSGPLSVRGGIDLAPPEVNRPGRPPLPYSHLELLFDEPVAGSVVIGAGRQRGLGLCVPRNR